jgi:hypothetical protein
VLGLVEVEMGMETRGNRRLRMGTGMGMETLFSTSHLLSDLCLDKDRGMGMDTGRRWANSSISFNKA